MMRLARSDLKKSTGETSTFAGGAKILDREKAIDGYTDYIVMYALKGLLEYLRGSESRVPCDIGDPSTDLGFNEKGDEFMWNEPSSQWPYQRWLIGNEFPEFSIKTLTVNDVDQLFTILKSIHLKFFKKVKSSKEKDDKKGKNVKLYSSIHTPAKDDKVVTQLEKEHGEIVRMCKDVLKKFGAQSKL